MKIKKTTLPNGLRVVTVPVKDAPTVTMLVMVEAGSKYETKDINGLSHFLEHMCFKGTKKRPNAIDISRELDAIGAQYNAFTSQEYTGYYAKAHPKHIGKLVDVISDMYLNPVFKSEEIEKEKGVIVQEILMYEDMPHRHVGDLYNSLLYGDQPAGWNIAGTPELVRSFTRDHFIAYRDKHYVASGTVVVVAGSFNEKKILADIRKAFAHMSTATKHDKVPVCESQEKAAARILQKKTDQTHMIIGVRSFPVGDKRIPVLKVLDAVLGGGMSSRLFQKMRDDLGICYYVRAGSSEYTDHGEMAVSTGVDSKRVKIAVEAILAEFKKLTEKLVPAAELAKAKEHLVGSLYLGLESSDAIAEFSSFQEILRRVIQTPDQYAKQIQAVTAAQVRAVAREIFTEKNLNLALIGNNVNEQELTDALKF